MLNFMMLCNNKGIDMSKFIFLIFLSFSLLGCSLNNERVKVQYVFVNPPIVSYSSFTRPKPFNFKDYLSTSSESARESMCMNTLMDYEVALSQLIVSRQELSRWVIEQQSIFKSLEVKNE